MVYQLKIYGDFPSSCEIENCSLKRVKISRGVDGEIKEIVCVSYNRDKLIFGLPESLEFLDISVNMIEKIENIPKNVKHLICPNNYIREIDNLPNSLEFLDISRNFITKLKGLPLSLQQLDVSGNGIDIIENLPENLSILNISRNRIKFLEEIPLSVKEINVSGNQIKFIEGLNSNLVSLDISDNYIKKIDNLPWSLDYFNCSFNDIIKLENLNTCLKELICLSSKIKVIENLPLGLKKIEYNERVVKFIDDVLLDSINFTLIGYQAIRRIQLRVKRRHLKKVNAAKVIQKGMWRWLFAGICRDNSISIDLRLSLLRLKEDGIELS